jgi:transcriptional regulator with XRE-family HTH domain
MSDVFGAELKRWRTIRGVSQVGLARIADVSQRHVSFLETGRSRPSHDMALRLLAALDVPAVEYDLVLRSAGFESQDNAPSREDIVELDRSVEGILASHEPWPSIAVDTGWQIVAANRAFVLLLDVVFPTDSLWDVEGNLLELILHPDGLLATISAPDRLRRAWVMTLVRAAVEHPHDEFLTSLSADLAPVDVSASAISRRIDQGVDPGPLAVSVGDADVEFLTMIATISGGGAPLAPERHIVTFVPLGERSDERWSHLVERR